MNAIDFRGAVFRGWRLIVLFALIGTAVGYFVSAPKANSGVVTPLWYNAVTIVGPQPGKHSVSVSQLYVDIKQPTVLNETNKLAGTAIPIGVLANQILVVNGKAALGITRHNKFHVKALAITVSQYTPAAAAAVANAVATAVDDYLNTQAVITYDASVRHTAAVVQSLETQLTDLATQIQNTDPSDPSRGILLTHRSVVTLQLAAAIKTQLHLSLGGPAVPGYSILRTAGVAPVYNTKKGVASIVGHRSTKVLGGALVGLLAALAVILAVEILDKSLRTVRAVESSFDFPVVAEIPQRGSRRPSTQTLTSQARLDVVSDPGSAAAEAYRRLHTAVLLEPLAAELAAITNGNGYGNGFANGYGNGHGNGNGGQLVRDNGGADTDVNGSGHRNLRQVILVVSPGREPTRSSVVANLAAVFAESGDRALVVSVGNLDWRPGSLAEHPALPRNGEIEPDDLAPLTVPSPVDGVSQLMLDRFLESRGQVVTQGPGIVAAARRIADVVLVDAPGLLIAHDAIALLPAVDVVLVVAQHAVTKFDQAQESGDVLRRFRAPVLGVVFTNVPTKTKWPRGAKTGPDPVEPVPVALDPMPTAPVTGAGLWV